MNESVSNNKYVYSFSTILWIIILITFDLSNLSPLDYMLLAIPPVLFFIALASSPMKESDSSKSNVLATGLLVALPLLIWLRDNAICNKKLFNKIIVTSLILSLMSMLDIWTSERYIFNVRHLKSSFQTMSFVLLAFAFFRFYTECPTNS